MGFNPVDQGLLIHIRTAYSNNTSSAIAIASCACMRAVRVQNSKFRLAIELARVDRDRFWSAALILYMFKLRLRLYDHHVVTLVSCCILPIALDLRVWLRIRGWGCRCSNRVTCTIDRERVWQTLRYLGEQECHDGEDLRVLEHHTTKHESRR